MKTGAALFWIGFVLTFGIILAYLIVLLCGAFVFDTWVTSISVCGIVLVGAALMVAGRNKERNSR